MSQAAEQLDKGVLRKYIIQKQKKLLKRTIIERSLIFIMAQGHIHALPMDDTCLFS